VKPMKSLITWLTALALCLAATMSQSSPARADYMTNSQDAICTPHFAEWRNFSFDSDDPDPSTHRLDPRSGSLTQILSCKLGNHYVRINYLTERVRQPHCIGDQGYVSAWVDGVKIVNRETFANDQDVCDADQSKALISKIIVNRAMHLTLCRRADNGAGAESCTVVSLALAGKARDSAHDGPLVSSPDKIDLIKANSPVCRQIPADPLIMELPEEKLFGDRDYDPDNEANNSGTFAVDLDNDGVADTVTRQVAMFAGYSTADFSWQNGKTKQSLDFDEITKQTHAVPSNDYAVLHIGNSNYIYALGPADQSCYLESRCKDRSGEDTMLHLVAGDGSGHELCRWRPRGKPEERL